MTTFIASFIIIAIATIGMAVGVLLGRPAIKGTCGDTCSATKQKVCAKRQAQSDRIEQ
jgi:uncharacterized protein